MSLSDDSRSAVVVLPALCGGRLDPHPQLRRWLSRGSVARTARPEDSLSRVLDTLQLPLPDEGLAALRMWGQTGDRPTVWLAALDPVYLEPRLDHLRLHALGPAEVTNADLRGIFDSLQATLSGDGDIGFARIGRSAYLRSERPLASALHPAETIDGLSPNDYMPTGEGAGEFRQLLSEIEMSLHEHEVNLKRDSLGLVPINSLWLWGGGRAPAVEPDELPPLYGSDALLRGYWLSRGATARGWPSSIAACVEASNGAFVAVPEQGAGDIEWIERVLSELRNALNAGHTSRVILLLADGHRVELRRSDRWRLWRKREDLFQ